MTQKKLTDDQVRKIRKMANDPRKKYTLKIIAERFGVSDTVIGQIKRHEIYAEVKDD
jgi:hypothetical protein